MSENNDNSSESNSLSSDSILHASRLTGGGGVVGNPVLRAGVLRPSVLGPSRLGSAAATNSGSGNAAEEDGGGDGEAEAASASAASAGGDTTEAEKVNEEVASNPFMKEHKDDDEKEDEQTGSAATKNKDKDDDGDDKETDDVDYDEVERPDPLSLLRKNGLERANLFAAARNSIPRVEKSGFVFGQNVHERVVGENINPENKTKETEKPEGVGASSGDLLFSSVIQNAPKTSETEGRASGRDGAEAKTLTDVAREYEESRAQKRKFEEVETFTGEENEVNIIDVNCKLFAFINSNWEERGRGSLRLNDSKNEQECSRVVFRTSGNLRLLLNTKVWAGMVAERPSQKSLRLTAMDNTGKIKIFLVMARPAEINLLYTALVWRINTRKTSHPDECCVVSDSKSEKNGGESQCKDNSTPEAVKEADEDVASTAESPHNDSIEPSPKKSLLAVTTTNTDEEAN